MDEIGEMSMQEKYAPNSICFGCGPANKKGLKIKSYRNGEGLKMEFQTSEEHQAFPGIINGGIIGTLLDCHGNWVAAIALMDEEGLEMPPCTVTASYSIKLRRPTPANSKLSIKGKVSEIKGKMVNVELEMKAGEKICATGEGTFVAIEEGHPAYHRWN
ncbi:MAG: PaaI family thioesterase [Candidatus Poseidoniales archaeon]|nr:MAG: PaaI family thioesterase [Candidatus Poseidoniales archaeon]